MHLANRYRQVRRNDSSCRYFLEDGAVVALAANRRRLGRRSDCQRVDCFHFKT